MKAKNDPEVLKIDNLLFKEWLLTHCGHCEKKFTKARPPHDQKFYNSLGRYERYWCTVENPYGRYINGTLCEPCWIVEKTCASCHRRFSIDNPGTSWPYPKWGSPGRLCYSCKS